MSLLWIKSVVICRFETIGADIGSVLILFVIIDFVRVRRWMLRLDYDLLLFRGAELRDSLICDSLYFGDFLQSFVVSIN